MPQLFQILIGLFSKFGPKILEFIEDKINQNLTPNQTQLIKDSQPLTSENDNFILVKYTGTGINEYVGKSGEKVKSPWATGILSFKGHEISLESGYWGKGFAPRGEYKAKNYREESDSAYSLFGVGFFVSIIPLFETDRTNLGIHFDGGDGSDGKEGFLGTLGCIGLKCRSLDEAIKIKNIFRDAFDSGKEYPLRII